MNLKQWLKTNTSGTDADAAAAYNADPAHYSPVPSHRVLAWMGEAGRLAKLKGFIAATADSQDANVIGLRSAIETVLIAAGNPTTEIEVAPTSPHRALLAAAVSAGVLSSDDAEALWRRGLPLDWTDATESDVTAARAAIAREEAASPVTTAIQQQAERLRAIVVRYQTDGDVTLPDVATVEAPEGFAFDPETGRLVGAEGQ